MDMNTAAHRTDSGAIPSTWTVTAIRDIAKVVRGSSPRPAGDPRYFGGNYLSWITVADITNDEWVYLDSTKACLTLEGSAFTRILPPQTVILSNSGATLGVPKITTIEAGANDGVAALLEPKVDKLFLYYCIENLTEYLRNNVAPGVGQPNLNTELIGKLRLAIPPLAEQLSIGRCLLVWDKALDVVRRIIETKRNFRDALNRLIFESDGKIGNFNEWPSRYIAGVTKELSLRNDYRLGPDSICSVTKEHGITKSSRSIVPSIDRYKIVPPQCFAYNPMRLNIGSIGCSAESTDVLVSPDYVVFECNRKDVLPEYLNHYVRSTRWHRQIKAAGNGSVRIRIYYKDLCRVKLPLPPVAVQRKIARLFDAITQELDRLTEYRNLLRQQKRWLLAGLLSGAIRIENA